MGDKKNEKDLIDLIFEEYEIRTGESIIDRAIRLHEVSKNDPNRSRPETDEEPEEEASWDVLTKEGKAVWWGRRKMVELKTRPEGGDVVWTGFPEPKDRGLANQQTSHVVLSSRRNSAMVCY